MAQHIEACCQALTARTLSIKPVEKQESIWVARFDKEGKLLTPVPIVLLMSNTLSFAIEIIDAVLRKRFAGVGREMCCFTFDPHERAIVASFVDFEVCEITGLVIPYRYHDQHTDNVLIPALKMLQNDGSKVRAVHTVSRRFVQNLAANLNMPREWLVLNTFQVGEAKNFVLNRKRIELYAGDNALVHLF